MTCPECDGLMGVTDSRPGSGPSIRRRRKCRQCGLRATTYEIAIPDEQAVIVSRATHGSSPRGLRIKRVVYLDPRPLYAELET